MDNKKKILIPIGIVVLIGMIILFYFLVINSIYNRAIKEFNSGNYDYAKYDFDDIPDFYRKTKEYSNLLSEYDKRYQEAVNCIVKKNYDDSLSILFELPNNYKNAGLLIEGMDKIKILMSNEWEDKDNGTKVNQGWAYYSKFVAEESYDGFKILLLEDEYLDNKLVNSYTSGLSYYELLKYGKSEVKSSEQDDFIVYIDELSDGKYVKATNYLESTFIKK